MSLSGTWSGSIMMLSAANSFDGGKIMLLIAFQSIEGSYQSYSVNAISIQIPSPQYANDSDTVCIFSGVYNTDGAFELYSEINGSKDTFSGCIYPGNRMILTSPNMEICLRLVDSLSPGLCSLLSGSWTGKTIDPRNKISAWSNLHLKFQETSEPSILHVSGSAKSINGVELSFSLEGEFNIKAGKLKLMSKYDTIATSDHKGNSITYSANFNPSKIEFDGRGLHSLHLCHTLVQKNPHIFKIPYVLKTVISLISEAPPISPRLIPIPEGVRCFNDELSSDENIPIAPASNISAVSAIEELPIQSFLTGSWCGFSLDKDGKVTKWKSMKLDVCQQTTFSSSLSFSGMGVSEWRQRLIPFEVRAVCSSSGSPASCSLVKGHTGAFTNEISYECTLLLLSASDVKAFLGGSSAWEAVEFNHDHSQFFSLEEVVCTMIGSHPNGSIVKIAKVPHNFDDNEVYLYSDINTQPPNQVCCLNRALDSNNTISNTSFNEADICKICCNSEIDCVLIPCGHLAMCLLCARKLEHCPYDRQHIEKVQPVYRV